VRNSVRNHRRGLAAPRSYAVVAVTGLAIASLASPGALAQHHEHASPDPLSVDNPWVRAMPPTQRMTAAYMVLGNDGEQPLTVSGVRAAGADASLHATTREGDTMRMVAVPELVLAPGERAVLAPGGLHIMLMGMQSVPAPGETVELCLQTSAGETCVEAPVRRDAPGPAPQHAH
jgi:copper(I)-binding protein